MFVKLVSKGESETPEWFIIELQGKIFPVDVESFDGQLLGEVYFSDNNKPMIHIGNYTVEGNIVNLSKPMIVTAKANNSTEGPVEHVIEAVIRRKLLFNDRPQPVFSHHTE